MKNEAHLFVHVDTGSPVLAGQMWSREESGRATCVFRYSPEWVANPSVFALDPLLPPTEDAHHIDRPLFGAMDDSCPDRWGRLLFQRAVGRQRALRDADYLVMVDDSTRHGALRFSESPEGPFLAAPRPSGDITLAKLERAARHVMSRTETQEELRLLLAPGSSLGGAHPKATLVDAEGKLILAKFWHEGSDHDPIRWECVALSLAAKAGIETPNHSIKVVNHKPVLLVDRFDRGPGGRRIPFLSAMTMLNARDHEVHNYMEIADSLRQYGAEPEMDLQSLWRRIVFNVMISNLDDHLRNHGFLHDGRSGWRLSPIYDLNPIPKDLKPGGLSTFIKVGEAAASLDLAMSVHEYFELNEKDARGVVRQVRKAVRQWEVEAAKHGISKKEIRRMESAFHLAEEPGHSAWQRKRGKPGS